MQNINLHNYQDFLLRYIDEELNLRETEALLAFVALHPAIGEELESLQSTKLDIESITYPSKALLYKNIFPVTLEPTTIVYPNKQKLFKKEKEKAPVILLRWWAVGAAAVFIFIVARNGMFNGDAGNGLSKNSVAKNNSVKPVTSPVNNAINNISTPNDAIVNTGSLASTNVKENQQNITTTPLERSGLRDVAYHTIQNASTVTASEAEHTIPSYNGSILDVKPSKVILEMPFATLQDAVAGRMRTMQLPAEPLSTLLTFWGGVELGAWAFNYQPQKDAAAINCPVLLQWGVNDPRVTESETHQIFKNLASHQKELIKYLQSGHQSLCKNEKSKWYMTVGRFLMM